MPTVPADEDSDPDDQSIFSVGDGFDAFLERERVVPDGEPGSHTILYHNDDVELMASPRYLESTSIVEDSASALGGMFSIPVHDGSPKSNLVVKKKGAKFSTDAKKVLNSYKSNNILSPKMIISGTIGVHGVKKMRAMKLQETASQDLDGGDKDGIFSVETRDTFDDMCSPVLSPRGPLPSSACSPITHGRNYVSSESDNSVPSLVISSRSSVTEAFDDNSVHITSKIGLNGNGGGDDSQGMLSCEKTLGEISRRIETIREEGSGIE